MTACCDIEIYEHEPGCRVSCREPGCRVSWPRAKNNELAGRVLKWFELKISKISY